MTMAKVSMTFRIDAELAKRLKESVAKSGGKLTQAEVIESALADRFAVKDGTRLLAKVNQDQATAVTLVKEQSQQLAEFQEKIRTGINGFAQRMHTEVTHLQATTDQKLSDNTASIRTMQGQVSGMEMTMRKVENVMERAAESRLGLLHWIGIFGFGLFSLVGTAMILAMIWQRLT